VKGSLGITEGEESIKGFLIYFDVSYQSAPLQDEFDFSPLIYTLQRVLSITSY
jgi:hypothetical protein